MGRFKKRFEDSIGFEDLKGAEGEGEQKNQALLKAAAMGVGGKYRLSKGEDGDGKKGGKKK